MLVYKCFPNIFFIVNRPKTENETVYYNVDYIHTAIYENKEIKFHYAEWTVKKELKLKKDGAFYVVSPWALEERIKKIAKLLALFYLSANQIC